MGSLNPVELEASIRALLAANQKIAAVKLYREQTGLGLAESKEAVEVCERGGPLLYPGMPGPRGSISRPADGSVGLDQDDMLEAAGHLPGPAYGATHVPRPGGLSALHEAQVLEHLTAGRKIEAIKVYRQATGVGLKQAKDAVEALARRNGIDPGGGGCLGVLTLAAVGLAGMASLAALWTLT